MIDFRYHLVSLVSVFLALAVGIVLGAGPLKGTIGDTLSSQVDQLRTEKADLRTQLDTAQAAAANRDTFTRTVLPSLVGNQLGGESVLILTLPGADTDAVEPLVTTLQAAGARVTGRVDVKDSWTDPARAADRDAALRTLGPVAASSAASSAAAGAGTPSVTPSSTPSAGGAPVPTAPAPTVPVPSVSGATNSGTALTALLARAVVTTDLGQAGRLDPVAVRLLDGLRKGGLVDVSGDLTGRATAVVVLAPGVEPVAAGAQPSPSASGSGDPLAQWGSLAVGLDARSDGVVVVGPASSATAGGVVEALRAQETITGTVSTVDTGGTPMGDVTAVLALREQSLGGVGSYGFVGKVKAPLPALSEVGTP